MKTLSESSTRGQRAYSMVTDLWSKSADAWEFLEKLPSGKGSQYPDHHQVGLQHYLRETGLQHLQADVWHWKKKDRGVNLPHTASPHSCLSMISTLLPRSECNLPDKLTSLWECWGILHHSLSLCLLLCTVLYWKTTEEYFLWSTTVNNLIQTRIKAINQLCFFMS